MTLLLPYRRPLLGLPFCRNELWRRARAVPSLDQRFADDKSLRDAVSGQQLITFTRASSGKYTGSDGVLQTASNDEPRFDHDPTTGESLGLLVEEQRTNSIRNNTMVGAVAGTPPTNWSVASTAGGITSSVIGTGVENGINYVDFRITGTSTSSGFYFVNFDLFTATAASSGQAWTCSAYMGVVSGSFTGTSSAVVRVIERAAGGSYVGETTTSFLGITNTQVSPSARIVTTRASMGATTQFVSGALSLGISSADLTIDITLRIGMPQLEQGAFATSVIPTTGTAATRSADVASISGSNFSSWYRQDEGTVFAQSSVPAAAAFTGRIYTIGNATDNISAYRQVDFQPVLRFRAGNSDQAILGFGATWTDSATRSIAQAYKANDFAGSVIGGTVQTDASGTLPSPTALSIGNQDSASFINGHIRRLTYWPQRLGNEVLQRITQ